MNDQAETQWERLKLTAREVASRTAPRLFGFFVGLALFGLNVWFSFKTLLRNSLSVPDALADHPRFKGIDSAEWTEVYQTLFISQRLQYAYYGGLVLLILAGQWYFWRLQKTRQLKDEIAKFLDRSADARVQLEEGRARHCAIAAAARVKASAVGTLLDAAANAHAKLPPHNILLVEAKRFEPLFDYLCRRGAQLFESMIAPQLKEAKRPKWEEDDGKGKSDVMEQVNLRTFVPEEAIYAVRRLVSLVPPGLWHSAPDWRHRLHRDRDDLWHRDKLRIRRVHVTEQRLFLNERISDSESTVRAEWLALICWELLCGIRPHLFAASDLAAVTAESRLPTPFDYGLYEYGTSSSPGLAMTRKTVLSTLNSDLCIAATPDDWTKQLPYAVLIEKEELIYHTLYTDYRNFCGDDDTVWLGMEDRILSFLCDARWLRQALQLARSREAFEFDARAFHYLRGFAAGAKGPAKHPVLGRDAEGTALLKLGLQLQIPMAPGATMDRVLELLALQERWDTAWEGSRLMKTNLMFNRRLVDFSPSDRDFLRSIVSGNLHGEADEFPKEMWEGQGPWPLYGLMSGRGLPEPSKDP